MNFEETVLPHLDAAYNLARWLTRNEHDAQDVVQEAYLRALRFFAGFHGSDARAWLLTIVRNTGYTWLRRNRSPELSADFDEVVRGQESDEPGPEMRQVMKAQTELVNEAIEKLPMEFREVIVLRELEELSYKEIAAVTGIPIGTVMSRLARARKRLHKSLRELLPVKSFERQEGRKVRGGFMNKEVGKGLARIGLLVIMTMIAVGTSAKAQSLEYKITANIPFDFTVTGKKFEAGKYSIGRAVQGSGDMIVQISSADGQAKIFGLTIPVTRLTSTDKATLIFHRYGGEYFLAQVWPAAAGTGRALPKSRSERNVERKVHDNFVGMAAMKAQGRQIITVIADLP